MPQAASPHTARPARPLAARRRRERIQALALVGALLVLLAAGVVVVLTLARANRLQRQVRTLEQRVLSLDRNQSPSWTPNAIVPSDPASSAVADDRAASGHEAHAAPADPGPTTGAANAATMDEPALAARLTAVLEPDDLGGFRIADEAAAAQLVSDVLAQPASSAWSARSWELLAVLAWRSGRLSDAERFAQSARGAGGWAALFFRTAADDALERGLSAEAARWIRELTRVPDQAGAARLRAAELALSKVEFAAAEQFLSAVQPARDLSPVERLRFGEALVDLELWPALLGLLAQLDDIPRAAAPRREALLAIAALQRDPGEASIAALERLAEAAPQDGRLALWRSVGLMRRGQIPEARAALRQAASLDRGPAPIYWSGVLALRTGDAAGADDLFQEATRAAPQYAPAHEALGIAALNRGEIEEAKARFVQALNHSPARTTSQFLIALCEAKAGNAAAAADALHKAIAQDPSFAALARETEALAGLSSAVESAPALSSQPTPTSAASQP